MRLVVVGLGALCLAVLMGTGLVLFVGTGVPPLGGLQLPASTEAQEQIPPDMLALYQSAASDVCPGLPWTVLAGIGYHETRHGRATAVSVAGARGPMQFLPSTFELYGKAAPGSAGAPDINDPADAVYSAANYLCESGGGNPDTLRQAVWAYNHADWYVNDVLTTAATYGQMAAGPQVVGTGDGSALLASPRVQLTPHARADLAAGVVDARVIAMLETIATRHEIAISVIKTGHYRCVGGGDYSGCNVSEHYSGRAVDIWMVDGQAVTFGNAAAREIVAWSTTLQGPLRPAEMGSPFTEFSALPGWFSDAAHTGHLHIGYGAS